VAVYFKIPVASTNNSNRAASGDNFRIQAAKDVYPWTAAECASGKEYSPGGTAHPFVTASGLFTSWKRLLFEVDTMFRAGGFLYADATAGTSSLQIAFTAQSDGTLVRTDGLNVGDRIAIFDAAHPIETSPHDEACIGSITPTANAVSISLNNCAGAGAAYTLAQSYKSSITSKTNLYNLTPGQLFAGVGRLSQPTRPAPSDIFIADLSQTNGAFADGFVEIIAPANGVGVVPLLPQVGNYAVPIQSAFSRAWFNNVGTPNYIHLTAAAGQSAGISLSDSYGNSLWTEKWIYSYVGTMERLWLNDPRRLAVAKQGNVPHELGHEFQVDYYSTDPDYGHDARQMWCADNAGPCSTVTISSAKTFCLMDPQQDRQVFKFCKQDLLDGGPNPTLPGSIRGAVDPL
jgi:hypothetical protein